MLGFDGHDFLEPRMPDADQYGSLNVFLRGSRTYVQGTQLIARVADRLADSDAVLARAAFSKITGNLVAVSRADAADDGRPVVGQVAFSHGEEEQGFVLLECEAEAPRLDLPMDITVRLVQCTGKLAGTYAYEGAVDLESTLNIIVQSTKALHETLGEGVGDVWFTGIRGFPLPAGAPTAAAEGLVIVEALRVMRSGTTYQSMLRVGLLDRDDNRLLGGHVTFAFRSDEVVDVD